ncbi:trypsin-like peptidase domain-containing protein [Paractinoplanes hotanensis]|uniref:Trypsin-like peptidase domain-containing protein n=1 Tax=Paractinoplanes hotanensis TaxID=2906497 RepID=A0ABT0XTG2_9ACTN|nr:trypsin-like peptidase domain-containing protein [Actinoplanes hotanensis]MCM4076472.1 trypsin-like peptidase domain-containing protein [Actinoplanes hotanensis]
MGAGGETLGTGFVAFDGGYVVTCWHVIDEVAEVFVQLEGDQRRAPAEVRRDLSHPEADIAVLRVPHCAHQQPVALALTWSAKEETWSYGYQYQAHVSSGYPVTGRISGDTVRDGHQFIVIADTDVQRGMSGAPLLDMASGRVVGVVHARLGNRGVALAVPIKAVSAHWPELRNRLARSADQVHGRVSALFEAMGYGVRSNPPELSGGFPSFAAEIAVGPVRVCAIALILGSDHEDTDVQRALYVTGSLLAERRYDKGFVVTDSGEYGSLQALASAQQITLLTVPELERTLIDFGRYLDAVVHDFENFGQQDGGGLHPVIDHFRWCDLHRYYIDLRAVDLLTGRHLASSTEALHEFLTKPEMSLLSVLGDYGTGKTSLCLQITYELADMCLRGEAGGRVPIFVPLRNFDKRQGIRRLIMDALADYGVHASDYRAFDLMLRAGRILVILDGFDEAADGLDRREVAQLFGQVSQLVVGNAKIVLTCRSHYFRSEDQSIETLTTEAMTPLMREIREHRGFGVMELLKLDEAQVLELMSRRSSDYMQRWVHMNTVYNLADLARTPILLNIILSSYEKLISQVSTAPIDSARLYEMYTKFWLERDDERSDITSLERLKFAQSLAWRMYTTDRLMIPYEELTAAVDEFFSGSYARDIQRFNRLDTNVRTCSFLARDRFGNLMFAHKSFMEFFVAKLLASNIGDWPGLDFGSRVVPYEIGDFVKQLVSANDVVSIKELALDRGNTDIVRGLCMDVLIGLGDTVRDEPLVFAIVVTEGGALVTANADGTATVLSGDLTIEGTLSGHDDWVRQVAVSPDGRSVVTCGWDGRVVLWALPGFARRGEYRLPERVNSVCFDRHSELLVCAGYDSAISVLSTATMAPLFELTGHGGGVNAVIASPVDDLIISAGLDKTLRVWSPENPSAKPAVVHLDEPVTRLAFARDGRFFASGSWAGEVTVWDARTLRSLWSSRKHANQIGAVGFSPDSEVLASSSDDRTVKIWRVADGALINSMDHSDFVTAVCFGRGADVFYCGGYDSQVHLYDVATWTSTKVVSLK